MYKPPPPVYKLPSPPVYKTIKNTYELVWSAQGLYLDIYGTFQPTENSDIC
jgi:hypothetical protein